MRPSPTPAADATLDARGMSCGTLEQLLWRRMREVTSGATVDVLCDGAAARDGVRAWSWLTGNELVSMTDLEPGTTRITLKRK